MSEYKLTKDYLISSWLGSKEYDSNLVKRDVIVTSANLRSFPQNKEVEINLKLRDLHDDLEFKLNCFESPDSIKKFNQGAGETGFSDIVGKTIFAYCNEKDVKIVEINPRAIIKSDDRTYLFL